MTSGPEYQIIHEPEYKMIRDPRWQELAVLYRYNWALAADVLFGKVPTPQQDIILSAIEKGGGMVTVSSGHGTGKSDISSIIVMLFIMFNLEARVIIVANKIQQVMTGIFKYIKMNWKTCLARFPWLGEYFVLTETAFYQVEGKGVWTVIPKGFRLGNEEALAGEHADHMLYIVDEASGVSDKAFGVMTGALTGKDNRMLLLSQPTRPSGYFYDSHHKLAKTPDNPLGIYTAIVLNSEESPLVTTDFIRMKLIEYGGRDRPEYMIKVLGQFPKSQEGFLLSRDAVELASRKKIKIHRDWGWIACVDVSGGTGRDKSVINIMKVSGERTKRRVINHKLIEYSDVSPSRLADIIAAECTTERYPNISIAIDADGIGMTTCDVLYEKHQITVQRIRWGKKMHSREDKLRFFDQRAYANVMAGDAIRQGRMFVDSGMDTIDQAAKIPVGITPAGAWRVMTKEDMKKKYRLKSPDRWDTYCFSQIASYIPHTEVLSHEDSERVNEALSWLND